MNHAAILCLYVEATGRIGRERSTISFVSSGIGGLRRVIFVGLSGFVYIAWFMTRLQMCDRPRRQKDSLGDQLHIWSRGRLGMWVEEEIRFFTLWHFYGGNCAMAWRLVWWRNVFGGGQKTFGGLLCLI